MLLVEVRSLLLPCTVPALVGVAAVAAVLAARQRTDLLGAAAMCLAVADVTVLVILTSWGLLTLTGTWPTRVAIVSRHPPAVAFARVAHLMKYLALALVVIFLPGLVGGLVNAQEQERADARWVAFDKYVTVRVSEAATQASMRAAEPAFRRVVQQEAAAGLVALSFAYENDPAARFDLGSHAALIVTNSAFLHRVGVSERASSWHAIGAATLDAHTQQEIQANVDLWVDSSAPQPRMFVVDGEVPGLAPSDGVIRLFRDPIVVIDDQNALNGEFLLAAASSGNVLFANSDSVRAAMERQGIADLALSYDGASDAANYRAQVSRQTLFLRGVSVVLIILTLVGMQFLVARIDATRRRRRIFAARSSGATWLAVYRKVLLAESIIVGGAIVASWALFTVLQQSFWGVLLLGHALWPPLIGAALVYWLLVVVVYCRAARREFNRSVHREW